ncbi:MAG TPA: hypothetical protein VIM31_02725 [Candidatus Microsaccharimonas sp.]|jgi:hypothetical protein
MSEHHSHGKDIDSEQQRHMSEEIVLRVVANGGNAVEATEALHTIGVTSEMALRVIYTLIDRSVIALENGYTLRLTEVGQASILDKGIVSGDIVELAETVVERKKRMQLLGQRLLEATKDSY